MCPSWLIMVTEVQDYIAKSNFKYRQSQTRGMEKFKNCKGPWDGWKEEEMDGMGLADLRHSKVKRKKNLCNQERIQHSLSQSSQRTHYFSFSSSSGNGRNQSLFLSAVVGNYPEMI